MKRKQTMLLPLLLLFAAAMLTPAQAQDYPRTVLLEQFFGMTCGGICSFADGQTNLQENVEEGVITLRYHVNTSGGNDPLALASGVQRLQSYGLSSVPSLMINGSVNITPNNVGDYGDLVDAAKGQRSPVNIMIERDFTNPADVEVRVTVQTSTELSNHRLYVAVNNRTLFLPDIGDQVSGHNGQTLFHDVFMGFASPDDGEALNIGAGSEQTFTYRYQPGSGDFWPAGQAFITAFVQEVGSREIVQAGTDFGGETQAEISIADAFERVPNSSQITKEVTVSNPDDFEQTFSFSISNEGFVPAAWAPSFEQTSITVPAGASATVNLILNSPEVASYAHTVIQVIGSARDDGLAPAYASATTGLLTDNTDIAHYFGYNNLQGGQVLALSALPAYNTRTALLPLTLEGVVENFPVTDFDAALFALSARATTQDRSDQILGMAKSLYDAGKGVFITSELSGNASFAGDGDQSFFTDVLGVNYTGAIDRVDDNNNTTPFPVNGFINDPIADGIAFQSNSAAQNFVEFTDVFSIPSSSNAEAIFISDEQVENIVGMRVADEGTARAVYMSVGLETVVDNNLRALLLSRIMDWISGLEAEIVNETDDVDYGKVKVNTAESRTIEFTNNGEALLIIRTAINGDDAASFSINDPSVVGIEPGATASVTIDFQPGEERTHTANLLVFSNASNVTETIEIPLMGNGVVSSVKDVPVGESATLSLAAGPNPFHSTSLINYTVKSEAGQDIRIALFNPAGQQVKLLETGYRQPGSYSVSLKADDLPAGSYMLKLSTEENAVVLPVVHLK